MSSNLRLIISHSFSLMLLMTIVNLFFRISLEVNFLSILPRYSIVTSGN